MKKVITMNYLDGHVFSEGFGIFPKIVARDKRLPLLAKVVYGLLMICHNSENSPSVEDILKTLKVGASRYYSSGINKLVEYEYLKIEKQYIDGRKTINNYIFNTTPNLTKDIDKIKHLNLENDIKYGLYNNYGIAPGVVLKDKDLSIGAKSVYLYLSVLIVAGDFTGKCYLETRMILDGLGISKTSFYEYKKHLLLKNYIKVHQKRIGNRNGGLIYYLVEYPNPANYSDERVLVYEKQQSNKSVSLIN